MMTSAIINRRTLCQGLSGRFGAIFGMVGAIVMALSCYRLASVWLLVGLPALFFYQPTKARAFLVIVTFYATLNVEEYADIMHFFSMNPFLTFVLWIIHALLFCAVWMFFFKSRLGAQPAFWRSIIFSVCLALPPLGFFVWIQPIIASGALFPGFGWLGLALTLVLMGLISAFSLQPHSTGLRLWLIIFVTVVLLANIHSTPAPPPNHALAINTQIGKVPANVFLSIQDQQREANKVRNALDHGDHLIILPENMTSWLPGSQRLWQSIAHTAQNKNARVFIGRVHEDKGDTFDSGFEILGSPRDKFLAERIPMPLGEWKPCFIAGAFHAHIDDFGIYTWGNERIAYLICYEQMIPYPILVSFLKKPTLIVGGANQWFASKRSYLKQKISMRAFARLFNVPTLVATNW